MRLSPVVKIAAQTPSTANAQPVPVVTVFCLTLTELQLGQPTSLAPLIPWIVSSCPAKAIATNESRKPCIFSGNVEFSNFRGKSESLPT